jgi:hypothetical protein
LVPILCRVWQGTFVLEHLAQIAAIDPAAASRAPNEMLGVALSPVRRPMYLPRGISVTFASLAVP